MKIALLDLNHETRGVHTNTVPLALGFFAHSLRNNLNADLDIKIFKHADQALEMLPKWRPQLVGLSQYIWNSRLNLHLAQVAKRANPQLMVVAGGPNLHLSREGRCQYLSQNPIIDLCVAFDGEIPFLEIVRRLLAGEKPEDLCQNPPAGCYAYDEKSRDLNQTQEEPPRLNSLDQLGTPYADGVFDEFLDDGFLPFVQTHRGCPFSCQFCHTSDPYYNRMLFQSPELFRTEIEYLAERFAGQDHVTLYVANTNMSLFEQDFAIAEIIREMKERYAWPRFINVNSGKNPDNLLRMAGIIDFLPTISLQTLTSDVLKNIKRRNIPFPDFVRFQQESSRVAGAPSKTELILSLPGETKDSFLETLKATLNSGVDDVVIYTHMKLKGTPGHSLQAIDRWGYEVRHRMVPRQFSELGGEKIFDGEEVIISTSDMSFADYLELRGLCFVISVFFGSNSLAPLKQLLIEEGADIYQWIKGIQNHLQNHPVLNRQYREYLRETEEELFPSFEAAKDFYSQPEHYQELLSGKRGDNLIRKYRYQLLYYDFEACLEMALSEAGEVLARQRAKQEIKQMLEDIKIYLSFRDLRRMLKLPSKSERNLVNFKFDVPSWMSHKDGKHPLHDYHRSVMYRVELAKDIAKRLEQVKAMNKTMDLSMQILYRDIGPSAFWPKWKIAQHSGHSFGLGQKQP